MNLKSFFKTTITIALAAFTLSFTSCDKEETVSASDLPQEIVDYINTHFPDIAIVRVEKDREDRATTYEVYLAGNIKLDFNKNNRIKDIDGVSKLPDSVIPAKILQYVLTNYPDNFITDWELEANHQQIELNNGLDIEFTMDGDFIRIDD